MAIVCDCCKIVKVEKDGETCISCLVEIQNWEKVRHRLRQGD